MAKIFGVLLIVLGVWIGMEIFTKGMDQAFGGALAGFAEPSDSGDSPRGSLVQRARDKVESSMQHAEDGANRASGDEDDD
jgi:hypothetical protein